MSYASPGYGDAENIDGINYENRTPNWFDKYFEETSGPEVKQQPSPQEQDSPWFEKYFQEEPSTLENFANTFIGIPSENIAAGFRSIPRTGFELLKDIVRATGGNLKELEEAQENAPDWLKKVASYAFPTFEEVRQKQLEQGGTPEETPFQKGLGKLGRFVGESPATGGIGGVKGLAGLAGLAGGLQVAEEEELGPLGQLGFGFLGSLAPSAGKNLIQGVSSFVKNPKKALANVSAHFTPKNKLALQKQIIEDARKSGVELDIGSITNSNLLKQIQSTLAQSGFTGKPLDELRERMTKQIIDGYKNLSEGIGKERFDTAHHAGDVIKNAITAEKDIAKRNYREMYNAPMSRLTDQSIVYPERIIKTIESLEKELTPGSVKGTNKKSVLNLIEDVKKDVMTPEGHLKGAKVKDLINDKIELHDILDYEVQGGVKDKLKTLTHEIDQNIQEYARTDPLFAKEYKAADKQFSEYAKTFGNKNIASILKTQDPAKVLNRMKDIQGIRDIKKSLNSSAEGQELFNELKRFKLDDLISKNFETGASNQIKFGTFSNILKKANNREIIKELLGPQDFKKFEDLAKTSGQLAESANKFLNASQSTVRKMDYYAALKILGDLGLALAGNPWHALSSAGGLAGARILSGLISDPKFLRYAEDAVLALKSNNTRRLEASLQALGEYARTVGKAVPELNEQVTNQQEQK